MVREGFVKEVSFKPGAKEWGVVGDESAMYIKLKSAAIFTL